MKFDHLFRRKDVDQIISEAESRQHGTHSLVRSLSVRDLTFLGIAAIIGAGIFGTIGNAASHGGPGVSLLFVFTAIACLFSALCYAQFASSIPIAGSAYTYAYTSFGELVAWIIGWDLLMEYAIGNVTVAISWSDYFTTFLNGFNLHLQEYLTLDYLSAKRAFQEFQTATPKEKLGFIFREDYRAWVEAPSIAGIKIIADIPALLINVVITYLVYIGIKESKKTNNALVILKLAIIVLVIVAGAFYVTPSHWTPFAPNGLGGIMHGVSAVFFAYIGFDAISTTAEESINPKKDLPRAMILALVVCTIFYVAITFILTGMVHYSDLNVGDPLAYAFEATGLDFLSGVVAAGAVIAMTSVLLVFQLGQPRIWMSMSRDGLLPKAFSKVHPKYQTPGFSTIITGVVVGLPILFFNLKEVTDLTSIGTLFAFVLVCGGVLLQPVKKQEGVFVIPYINSQYIIPSMFVIGWIVAIVYFNEATKGVFRWNTTEVFLYKIPFLFFLLITTILAFLSFVKKLSLIPVLGLITNLYLMSQLEYKSWERFVLWLIVGLIIYFTYGYKNSRLNR